MEFRLRWLFLLVTVFILLPEIFENFASHIVSISKAKELRVNVFLLNQGIEKVVEKKP
jgi:hypothetical protein